MPKTKKVLIKKKKTNLKKPKKTARKKLPPKKETVKINLPKTIKVADTEPASRFREIGEMVHRKEIKWYYYAVENFVGYHHYIKLNNNS